MWSIFETFPEGKNRRKDWLTLNYLSCSIFSFKISEWVICPKLFWFWWVFFFFWIELWVCDSINRRDRGSAKTKKREKLLCLSISPIIQSLSISVHFLFHIIYHFSMPFYILFSLNFSLWMKLIFTKKNFLEIGLKILVVNLATTTTTSRFSPFQLHLTLIVWIVQKKRKLLNYKFTTG